VVALALKRTKMPLSVLIVAWGSIKKVGIRSIVNNYSNYDIYKKWKI